MDQFILYSGVLIAAYAVFANDVIQTLGTFITLNAPVKWGYLWAFTGSILTLRYGWYSNGGNVSSADCRKFPYLIPCPGGTFWHRFPCWSSPV